MRIAPAHGKEQTLQHLRAPGYLLPTLAMPGLFYFLFEGPDTEVGLVTFLMASYAMWAILAVAFFQFGVGIAEERTTPWERFLRTLPLSGIQRLAGRVLSAALFAAAAAAVVIAEAHLIHPVRVAADQWLPWLGALGAGGVVMALGGIAIGYWASPRAAIALATLAWLLLAYLGGLWQTPGELPSWAAEVSRYLPTRLWGEVTGRRCRARPPRWGTGWAWRPGRWYSRSWPDGATGATRVPATAEAVRSGPIGLRRPTSGGGMEGPFDLRVATVSSMAIGFCRHRRRPVPPSPPQAHERPASH
jgi:ABC-2 type transport system permease protein